MMCHQPIRPGRAVLLAAVLVLSQVPATTSAAPFISAEQPRVADSPLAVSATDILLRPEDVGPGYVVVSSGQTVRFGVSVAVQTLGRAGKHAQYVESDGVLYVRSYASIASDPGAADREIDKALEEIAKDWTVEPLTGVGDRAAGGRRWGEHHFDPAGKLVLFRAGPAYGFVVLTSYEAPTELDDAIALARVMAERAVR